MSVLYDISFIVDIVTTHVEYHRRASAVLNRSIAAQLYEVGDAQSHCDMIPHPFNLLHLFDGEAELLALSDGQLVLKCKCGSGTSTNQNC